MYWSDLIGTARRLAKASPKKPRQSDLKRAVSSAYYAMFHALARTGADTIVGAAASADLGAWTQAYRSLEHGIAKNACKEASKRGFPAEILNFADIFVSAQEERHSADYDPTSKFTRADVIVLIDNCEQAIGGLKAQPITIRRAFSVWILMQRKR